MNIMAIIKHTFAVFVCFLPLLSCHFFSMKFFRELIPSKRVSDITVGKTEAASVTGCNLKCINKKPCISTLFTIGKNKCVLLKSFFDKIKEFAETAENNNAVKVIESRSQVSLHVKYEATLWLDKFIEETSRHWIQNANCQQETEWTYWNNTLNQLEALLKHSCKDREPEKALENLQKKH